MNDTDIASLRKKVKAAREEFDLAILFREVWRPSAYDKDLHKRMGVSSATNAFHVVRVALQREMLLALLRLWDKSNNAVRMDFIAEKIGDKRTIHALAVDRAARYKWPGVASQMQQEMSELAKKAVALADKYSKDRSPRAFLTRLRGLRHKRLAHREIEDTGVIATDFTDAEIESFYQDMLELIRTLAHLVLATVYDPKETADVYRHHATHFWAGVCGEQTEGHPNYRAPPRILPAN